MHEVLLGITRLFLKLWFNPSFTKESFSLYKSVNIVDKILTSIKPPHIITRTPRPIKEDLKFWKAAELRSWLFFYCIPCVKDVMKPNIFYHFCSLIEGIYLLSTNSISLYDLERSQRFLD